MRLLWFVSTLEDTNFLKEFQQHFEGAIDIFNINFITRLEMRGHKGVQLMPFYAKASIKQPSVDVSKVFNVLSGRLNTVEAQRAYKATREKVENYIEKFGDKFIMVIPSGRHIHHVAATTLAKEKNIKRIYINYSNFPGYTFFDPEGTDCQAAIFRDPARLNTLNSNKPVDVDNIFSKFAGLKQQQKSIPQVASSGLKRQLKSIAFVIDTLLQRVTGVYGDRRLRWSSTKKVSSENPVIYKPLLPDLDFLFFPLQVSTDQQVLVNYKGGSIFSAIDEAIEYAKQQSLHLYVREHPAEADKIAVREYLAKKQSEFSFFSVTQASVSELIEGCKEVITINSTVGLESRINFKPVKFLGRSFYQKASDEQLSIYLDQYLVEVDYHNPVFSDEALTKLLRYLSCE